MVDVPGVLISPISTIVVACALLAVAIVRGWWSPMWPHYRPIAAVLLWWLTFSTARAALQHLILRPSRLLIGSAPYPWPMRGAFFLDVAARLSWPFALVAACLVVYARRRPWSALLGWAIVVAAVCRCYPAVRGDALLHVEALISTACWIWCAWLVWRSYDHGDVWIASHMSLVPILGAQLGVIVSVAWGHPIADWGIARLVQGAGYVLLLTYQVRQIRKVRDRDR